MSAVACNPAASTARRCVGQKRPRQNATPERPRLCTVSASALLSPPSLAPTSKASRATVELASRPIEPSPFLTAVPPKATACAVNVSTSSAVISTQGSDGCCSSSLITAPSSSSLTSQETVLHEWPMIPQDTGSSPVSQETSVHMPQPAFPFLYSLAYYAPALQPAVAFNASDAAMLAHAQAGYAAVWMFPPAAGAESVECTPSNPPAELTPSETLITDTADGVRLGALRKLHAQKATFSDNNADLMKTWDDVCSEATDLTGRAWDASWDDAGTTELQHWTDEALLIDDAMDTADPASWEAVEPTTSSQFTDLEEDEAPLLPEITPMDAMDTAWNSPWDAVSSLSSLPSPAFKIHTSTRPKAQGAQKAGAKAKAAPTSVPRRVKTEAIAGAEENVLLDPCGSTHSERSSLSEPSHAETGELHDAAASHPSENSQCTSGGVWHSLNIQVPGKVETMDSDSGSPVAASPDSAVSSPHSMHSDRATSIWNDAGLQGSSLGTPQQGEWRMPVGMVCQQPGCGQKAVPSRDGQCLYCIAHIRQHIQKLRRAAQEAVCRHEGCSKRALPSSDGQRLYCSTHCALHGVRLPEGMLSTKCQQTGCHEWVAPSTRGPRLYCKVHMKGRKAPPRKQPCQHPSCSKGAQASADGPCMYCVSHMRMHGLQPYKKQKCQQPACVKLARRGTDGLSKFCATHMKLHGIEPLFKH